MPDPLCGHLNFSDTGRALMRCEWPAQAHADVRRRTGDAGTGLIADHDYELPVSPDDMPAELREPLRLPWHQHPL